MKTIKQVGIISCVTLTAILLAVEQMRTPPSINCMLNVHVQMQEKG